MGMERKASDEVKPRAAAAGIKKIGKAAANTAAGAGLAASLLVGGAFASPDEMIKSEPFSQPAAIVRTVSIEQPAQPFGLEGEAVVSEEEKKTRRQRLAAWFAGLPLALRLLMLLPVWAIAFGVVYALASAVGLIGVPVVGAVVKFLLGAAAVLALALGGLKALFPDTPFKKLLGKRSLIALAACAGVFALAAVLAGFVWKDKPYITAAVDAAAAALYIAYFCLFVKRPAK